MAAANTRNAKAKLNMATATAARKRLVVKQKQDSLAAAKAEYDRTCKGNATAVECTALQVRPERARARTNALYVCVFAFFWNSKWCQRVSGLRSCAVA